MGKRKSNYIFAPEPKKKGGAGCFLIFLAALVAIAGVCFALNISANSAVQLNTEKVRVMSLDKSLEGLNILHVSDLHGSELGLDAAAWKKLLFGKSFSAVVMTGDMVGSSGDYSPLVSLIKTLKQIKDVPIYLIAGDDDPTPLVATMHGNPEVLADWVRAAQGAGALYLDRPMKLEVGKKVVWFVPEYLYSMDAAGMLDSYTHQKEDMEATGQQYEGEGGASYRALCYRIEQMTDVVATLKSMVSEDLQIALSHAPLGAAYIREMIEWADADEVFNYRHLTLLLAGHYCGGQWRLGSLGPVYVPDHGWFVGDAGVVGMERINSISQYISGGVGASEYYPLKSRFLNAPNVTLLTFTAKIE